MPSAATILSMISFNMSFLTAQWPSLFSQHFMQAMQPRNVFTVELSISVSMPAASISARAIRSMAAVLPSLRALPLMANTFMVFLLFKRLAHAPGVGHRAFKRPVAVIGHGQEQRLEFFHVHLAVGQDVPVGPGRFDLADKKPVEREFHGLIEPHSRHSGHSRIMGAPGVSP